MNLIKVFLAFSFMIIRITFAHGLNESDKLVNIISYEAMLEMKNNYGLKTIGFGQKYDKDIVKTISLKFTLKEILSKRDARILLLKCSEDFLKKINCFKEIQPFLANHPFNEENIELSIFFCS